MDESYCITNTACYVGMLSPACSPAQSCMQSSIETMRCWAQHLRPDSAVWPVHMYCIWPCQARQKYSCTVRSIIGLQHLPPWMKNQHGLNEEKNPYRKNNLSIESSEVNVWLVWILTTKRKSLKRVETCQKKHFNSWLFCHVNSFFQN